jgi:hypothetical protein
VQIYEVIEQDRVENGGNHEPVPRVVALAETVLHLRLPQELQHCGGKAGSAEQNRRSDRGTEEG